MKFQKQIKVLECTKCGHKWLPRVEEPRRCPRCNSWLDKNPAKERLMK